MSTENKPKPTGLALMREPFPEHQISKMCRSTKKENPKGVCKKCGGLHGLPSVQLSYVGHAALTDRLLEADPNWNWEPVAIDEHGFPYLDKDGGMWIKLTVCGVTRLGYGDNQNQTGGNATKERIGDALRNAAMRFGAALDLWHKGDLRGVDDEEEEAPKPAAKPSGNGHDKAADEFKAAVKREWEWFTQHATTDILTSILGNYGVEKTSELTAEQRKQFMLDIARAKVDVQKAHEVADKLGMAGESAAIDQPAPAQVEAEFERSGL